MSIQLLLSLLASINLVSAVPGKYTTTYDRRQFSVGNGNSFGVAGNATYDYVIVGGGTARNAIAARLAEDQNNRIAVVEAGGFYEIEDGNRSVVPGYAFGNQAPGTQASPLTDWGYYTTPQSGLLGQVLPYARGKTLGGCSALNYMAYHRYVFSRL